MATTTTIPKCPFCCAGDPIATALHVPKGMAVRYAAVCEDCDAQGPPATTPEEAIEAWAERAFEVDASPVESTDDLDDRLVMLAEHAQALRDGVACGDVDVERAVALGALSAVCTVLASLVGPGPEENDE